MFKTFTFTFCFVFACCLVLLCLGCRNGRSLSGLVPVEGTVYYDGKPLLAATIKFYPVNQGDNARTATGSANAEGRFIVTTLESHDGMYPGEYQVGISRYYDEVRNEPTTETTISERYESRSRSGLTAVIPSGGTKDLRFDLTSQ
ncbi:MAG: hypothetical protein LBT89_01990 [Planctomycetaceae bacterium]|jgi:hypothetical protein|nr:hypothetical protein [Planctomycetaceae bacterium]